MSSTLYAAAVPNAVFRTCDEDLHRDRPVGVRVQHHARDELADRGDAGEHRARHEAGPRGGEHDAPQREPARCAEPARRVLERRVHLAQRSLHRARHERDVADEVRERQDPERPDEQHAQLRRRVAVERRRETERDRRGRDRPRQLRRAARARACPARASARRRTRSRSRRARWRRSRRPTCPRCS